MQRTTRIVWNGVAVGTLTGVALGVVLYRAVRRGERGTLHEPADAIVVLGAQVRRDGTPSAALHGRAERAIALYHAGYAPWFVPTGGIGDAGIAEAAVVEALAVARGVPIEAIVLEPCATRTVESAERVTKIARERGWHSLIVVSDPFHLQRSAWLFAARGMAVQTAGTDDCYFSPRSRRFYRLRELAGIVIQGLNGELLPHRMQQPEQEKHMTIEEAYAEPITKTEKKRDRAFSLGILCGIAAGIVATVALNRSAQDDTLMDEEPVVELQPAMSGGNGAQAYPFSTKTGPMPAVHVEPAS